MKIKVPDYFTKFSCIADRCKDSCCIGWEIVIDGESSAKYSSLDNEIGREIAEKTKHGCFPLLENGRCAFLDGEGLCRIISSLGEGYLCDICREHPRYYGIGSSGIEGGLGLGCEEAARLIVNSGGNANFTYIEHNAKYFSEDEYAYLTDEIREIIYKKVKELDAKGLVSFLLTMAPMADDIAFSACAGLCEHEISQMNEQITTSQNIDCDLTSFFAILSDCEALSDEWVGAVDKAKDIDISVLYQEEKALKSLIFYFSHRYVRECVEDISLGQRILFTLFSALSVIAISKVIEESEAIVRAGVLFSKNIEYSTDNVNTILDSLSDFL